MDLVGAEALLVLAIVGLYLKDSLLLLRADEAVLVRSAGGRWHPGFGARGYRLAGKEPYLVHPLTPHAPVFRLNWSMHAPATPPAAEAGPAPAARLAPPPQLHRLAPFAWVAWLLLFVALPLSLLTGWAGGATTTLAAVGLLYVNIVAALVALWCLRAPLHVSGRAFLLLAFECLVCAPYAANLVRRVAALQPPVHEDFTAAAARLLSAAAQAEVHRQCLARIDEQLEAEDEGSRTALALQRARQRFVAATAARPPEGAA